MCWLRFGKRMPIVCTEAGPWHADILGLSDKMAIEIEVKKSRSDLQAEFRNKKAKHYSYANAETGTAAFVPNYLYFYVPEPLGEYATKALLELCPKAGLAIQTDTNFIDGRNTRIIRKPTRLRVAPPRPGFIRTAIQRMSSELCGRYIALEEYYERIYETVRAAERAAVDAAYRSAGALDCEDPEVDLEARARELKFCVEGTDIFLNQEDRAKWEAIARKWLEAQYLNSKGWENASVRL
jgi:hypothetical protein